MDETEIEVSVSQKRARTTSSDENNVHDHPYCIKSPRRVRRQVDDLIDKVTTEEIEDISEENQ